MNRMRESGDLGPLSVVQELIFFCDGVNRLTFHHQKILLLFVAFVLLCVFVLSLFPGSAVCHAQVSKAWPVGVAPYFIPMSL
jgi:hypothetical protein